MGGDERDLDVEGCRHLWAAVLERALLDLRDGTGRVLEDAASWFAAGATLELVAEALKLDTDFLLRLARRALDRSFEPVEVAWLLRQPHLKGSRRRGRRLARPAA